MNELLNINMDSSEIDEAWIRKHYNLPKERKTSARSIGHTVNVDEQAFNFAPVDYDKFFNILKDIIDANILHLIVENNITCTEKNIKIQLELSSSDWYGETEPSVYITIDWTHTETHKDIIKRLIGTNKRALTVLKRKKVKKNDLASKIKKLSAADREELLASL